MLSMFDKDEETGAHPPGGYLRWIVSQLLPNWRARYCVEIIGTIL
jgi:hypothetical protein